MRIYPLALIAGLLPLLAIHLCYFLAADAGHVPACNPYIHSCTSISSAGRSPPEFYLFKGLMIPAAVFIAAFWWYAYQWLLSLGCMKHRTRSSIIVLGLFACLGLILYSLMLGAIGDEYRVQRRVGVITFFSLTFVAQFLLVYSLHHLRLAKTQLGSTFLILKIILSIILSIALGALVISSIDSIFYDSLEDAFEWWVTSLQCIFVLVVAFMWKVTDFRNRVSVNLNK